MYCCGGSGVRRCLHRLIEGYAGVRLILAVSKFLKLLVLLFVFLPTLVCSDVVAC